MFNINWIGRRDVDSAAGCLGAFIVLGLIIGLPIAAIIALAALLDPLGTLPSVGQIFQSHYRQTSEFGPREPVSLAE